MSAETKQLVRIPVEELHFDPENPRLPRSVDGTDDQAVLEWMLQDAGLVELMGSIAVKGYFPAEPLLVMPAEGGAGYWVLEGNRRLAAVLMLLEPERAPRRKNAVSQMASQVINRDMLSGLPCAVFDDRDDVLDYLGYRHITGIKQWEPAAKARYLNSLYHEHRESSGSDVYRTIARIIGSRADYVMRLLGALQLYERILSLDVPGIEEESLPFSVLTLALNYRAVNSFLGLESLEADSFATADDDRLKDLATWLYVEQDALGRTQLGDSRNMKLLAAALSDASGVEALRRGETVEEAATATIDINDVFSRALRTARDRLTAAQSLVHRAEVSRETYILLSDVDELVAQLLVLVDRKLRRASRADV